jgi:hypothetical protein
VAQQQAYTARAGIPGGTGDRDPHELAIPSHPGMIAYLCGAAMKAPEYRGLALRRRRRAEVVPRKLAWLCDEAAAVPGLG